MISRTFVILNVMCIMLNTSRHILSNMSTIVTSPQPASLDRVVIFIGTKLTAMSESIFRSMDVSFVSRDTLGTVVVRSTVQVGERLAMDLTRKECRRMVCAY